MSKITALLAAFVIMILPYPSAAASFMSDSGVSEEEYNTAVEILTKVYTGEISNNYRNYISGWPDAKAIPTGTGESLIFFLHDENIYLTPYHYITLQKTLNEMSEASKVTNKDWVQIFLFILMVMSACLLAISCFSRSEIVLLIGVTIMTFSFCILAFSGPNMSQVKIELFPQIQCQAIAKDQIPQFLHYLNKSYAELSNTGTLLREKTVIEREISYPPVHRDNPTIIFMPGRTEHYKEETETKEETTNIVIPIRPSWER